MASKQHQINNKTKTVQMCVCVCVASDIIFFLRVWSAQCFSLHLGHKCLAQGRFPRLLAMISFFFSFLLYQIFPIHPSLHNNIQPLLLFLSFLLECLERGSGWKVIKATQNRLLDQFWFVCLFFLQIFIGSGGN